MNEKYERNQKHSVKTAEDEKQTGSFAFHTDVRFVQRDETFEINWKEI